MKSSAIKYFAAGLIVIGLALLGYGLAVAGEELPGTLDRIKDGDTFTVRMRSSICGEVIRTVRLAGVDCPEKAQPQGLLALLRVAEHTSDGFTVIFTGRRSWERLVVRVRLADGRDLAEVLAAEGLAWVDDRYATGAWGENLIRAMKEARAERSGLWAGKDPIPPKEWRGGRRK